MGKPQMVAYQLDHAQLTELTELAVELGGAAPTDEYLDDHADGHFLAVPVMHTTDDHLLVGLTAYSPDTMEPIPEPEKLPEGLTVEEFFRVIDGSRRIRHLRRPHIAAVFLEVPRSWRWPDETLLLPLDVGRFYQREGLMFIADQLGPGPQADKLKAEAAKLGF